MLVAITPFDYLLVATITIPLGSIYLASIITSITSTFKARNTITTIIIVIFSTIVSILALRTAQITSSLEAGITITTDSLGSYIIVAITNAYGRNLSLSASNISSPSLVGNPPTTIYSNNTLT